MAACSGAFRPIWYTGARLIASAPACPQRQHMNPEPRQRQAPAAAANFAEHLDSFPTPILTTLSVCTSSAARFCEPNCRFARANGAPSSQHCQNEFYLCDNTVWSKTKQGQEGSAGEGGSREVGHQFRLDVLCSLAPVKLRSRHIDASIHGGDHLWAGGRVLVGG